MGRGGGGRPPYPLVARLLAVADDEWAAIGGACAAQGVDPFALRLDEFCNLVYAWLLERTSDRAKLDDELNRPLPGDPVSAAPDVSTRRETQNAMAVAAWAAGVQGGR